MPITINETKMQIVIDNYFKSECDVNTSIRKAFEKGFRIGVQKGIVTAEHVRHGHWIEHHEPYTWMGYTYWSCSECGYECGYEKEITFRTNYCPHCGAKMDEREEDE